MLFENVLVLRDIIIWRAGEFAMHLFRDRLAQLRAVFLS